MLSRYMLALIIGLFSASYAFAEFYKYRDTNGVLRFTDNLGNVPEDQRPRIERYRETEKLSPTGKKASKTGRKVTKSQPARAGKDKKLTEVQRLIQEKNLLDQSYKTLMNEKMALTNQYQQIRTTAEVNKHRKLVEDFNRRTAKFEKQRYKYQHRAGTLSAQIKKEKIRQNRPKRLSPSKRCGDSRLCDQVPGTQ
jgi:hypothetical protein